MVIFPQENHSSGTLATSPLLPSLQTFFRSFINALGTFG